MEFEATDIGCRVVTDVDHEGDLKISLKATVTNNSDRDEAYVDIQGVDKDGFELVAVSLTGHIPVGRTRVLTTTAYASNSLFEQIVDWQQQ